MTNENIFTVEVDEVKQAIDTNKKCVILDVRTPQEFMRGHIQGSINLPVDDVEKNIASIVPNTNTLLYVYCLSGSRSRHVVLFLKNAGYSQAYDVSHGLLAWRVKGYPLLT